MDFQPARSQFDHVASSTVWLRARALQTVALPRFCRGRADRHCRRASRCARESPALDRGARAEGEERRPPLRRRPRALRHRLARRGRTRHGRRQVRAQPRRDREARGRPHRAAGDERRLGRPQTRLAPGKHDLTWTPDLATPVGSYVMRLTIDRQGAGRRCSAAGARPRSPGSRQRSSACSASRQRSSGARTVPGEPMELRILADAPALTLQFLHCGAEYESTERNDEMKGAPMGEPVQLDWTGKRSGPVTITVQTGDWPTGPLRRPAHDRRRTDRLRAVRPAPDDPGPAPAARRPADEHLAGLQLLRRRRRRLGRHVVRRWQPTRRARPALPRPRRAAALQGATTSAPELAAVDGEDARHGRPTTISRPSRRGTSCARSTTSSSSRGTAST